MAPAALLLIFALPFAIHLLVFWWVRRRLRVYPDAFTGKLPSLSRHPVLWSLTQGMFLGLMMATAGGALFPQVVQVTTPLVCDGTANVESHGYSYKPGQAGVSHTLTCDAGDGSAPRDITVRALVAATLVYGAIATLLLLLSWPLLMRSRRGGVVQGSGAQPVGPTTGLDALRDLLGNAGQSGSQKPWVVVNRNPSSDRALAALQELMQNADHATIDAITTFGSEFTSDSASAPGTERASDSATDRATDPGARLQALNHLHDKGLLTTSEYEAKRAQILSQL